ncbi:MAG: hypothetical protein ACXW10_08470 [Acidimicrobiia bacterium]
MPTPIVSAFPPGTPSTGALLDCLDPDSYHLNEEVAGFDRTAHGVTVHMAGGRAIETDLLVGADGTASTIRRVLLPEIAPQYAGYVAWRGTVPEHHLSPAARGATWTTRCSTRCSTMATS